MPRTILRQTYDELRRQMLDYVKHGHFETMYDFNGMRLIERQLFDVWNLTKAGGVPLATMVPQSFDSVTKTIVSNNPTRWIPGMTFTVAGAEGSIDDMEPQSFNNATHTIVSNVPTYWRDGMTFTVLGANTIGNDKMYTIVSVIGTAIVVEEAMTTDVVVGGVATADDPDPVNNKQFTVVSMDGVNIVVREPMVTSLVPGGTAVPDGSTATVVISSTPPAVGYLDPLTWLESWFFPRFFTEKDGKKFENEVMYYYSRLL